MGQPSSRVEPPRRPSVRATLNILPMCHIPKVQYTKQTRSPLHHQPSPRSVRVHGLAKRWDERRGAAILRLVQVSILALCVRPAGDGQGNPNLPGLPADAKGRELQPRCSEGGGGEQRPQPVTEMEPKFSTEIQGLSPQNDPGVKHCD
jgi:hypothetical protein